MRKQEGFDKKEKGVALDNLPSAQRGDKTGFWENGNLGTWWEVIRYRDGKKIWARGKGR